MRHGGRLAFALLAVARAALAAAATVALPEEVAPLRRLVVSRVGEQGERGPLIIGVGDGGECFVRMLENWLCHLRRLAIREYAFFALDERVHALMRARDEPVVRLRQLVASRLERIGSYGSQGYGPATFAKVRAALAVLELGFEVLVVDIDVALQADPRPYLARHAASARADMLFQLNFPNPDLNTGFYWARPSGGTLALMRAWCAAGEGKERVIDQNALNEYLASHCGAPDVSPGKNKRGNTSHVVRVRGCGGYAVRVESIPIGLVRTAQVASRTLPVDAPVLAWHANFVMGGQRKQYFLMSAPEIKHGWCAPNRTLCPAPWDKPHLAITASGKRAPGAPPYVPPGSAAARARAVAKAAAKARAKAVARGAAGTARGPRAVRRLRAPAP